MAGIAQTHVPGAAQHKPLARSRASSTRYGAVMRCKPGTVTNTENGMVPDLRCTANALHRVRDTILVW